MDTLPKRQDNDNSGGIGGWLLLGLGLFTTSAGLAEGYARYGLLARPGGLPATGYLAVYDDASFIAWPALLGFILLLTPTGSLPSRSTGVSTDAATTPPGRSRRSAHGCARRSTWTR
jgi:hypothetical protein